MPITALTGAQLKAELQELRDLATQAASIEAAIEAKVTQLELHDWGADLDEHYVNALGASIRGIISQARAEEIEWEGADDLRQEIEAALTILDLASKRISDAS